MTPRSLVWFGTWLLLGGALLGGAMFGLLNIDAIPIIGTILNNAAAHLWIAVFACN